ncbi:hypothetical protein, partial [Klebsiella sp. 10982]|uniref:hypothetical protein n=1 Tax=Klebsiella sp. 10982 TaxID=1196034 RepID=UPI0029D4110C
LSAKVSCWLIRLLILGSGYNTMISHLGLIRTFPSTFSNLNSKPESTIKNSIEKTVLPIAYSCQKVPDIKTKKPAVTRA